MMDKWLFLTWKKVLLIAGAWVLSVLAHNLVYALFRESFGPGGDEPVFFVLAVIVIPLYVVIAFFYTIIRLIFTPKVK